MEVELELAKKVKIYLGIKSYNLAMIGETCSVLLLVKIIQILQSFDLDFTEHKQMIY